CGSFHNGAAPGLAERYAVTCAIRFSARRMRSTRTFGSTGGGTAVFAGAAASVRTGVDATSGATAATRDSGTIPRSPFPVPAFSALAASVDTDDITVPA